MQIQNDSTTSARLATIGLISLCLILYVSFLGSNRALTAHEALLGGTTRQMVLSGDWLVPRIGDRTWLEKPPLPQWLAGSLAVLCGRFNEWTMRLPFALAGIAVVLLTVRLMTLLFDRQIGWISGVVQATSVYMVMYARLAESDMLLLALFMLAMTLFWEVEIRKSTLTPAQFKNLRIGFWILIGCTNLAKGLIFGAALVLFTCGGWLVMNRDWAGLRRWFSPTGMVLAIVIASAWPVAVVIADPAALELWQRHLFGRAAGTLGYTQPPWYYLTQWPLQLLPWTPFLLLAAPASWKAAIHQSGSDRFCWWWFLGQFVLLSCSSGKHHHYLIYALPALSPVISQGLIQAAAWVRDTNRSWIPSTLGLSFVSGCGLCAAVLIGLRLPAFRFEAWCFLPLLSCGLLFLAWQIQRRLSRSAFCTLLTLVVVGHLYAQGYVMPRVDTSAADKQFLAEVDQHVGPESILSACGSQEMALHIFYLKHAVLGIWKPEDLPAALPKVDEFYVVARGHAKSELAKIGDVQPVLQSRFTRRERTVDDRFTLFHVSTSSQHPDAKPTATVSQR